jgi:hypothetical protein
MKALIFLLLLSPFVRAQDSFTRSQAWCAEKAEANMKATREHSPEVAKTILSFLYEYSPRHHTCVAVMEYKTTEKDGKHYVQILARNMVTNQPMKGLAEIYLIPMEEKQERIDAINRLFDEYSK